MVLTSHIMKRISVLFLGLSAALWVAKLSLRDKEQEVGCTTNGELSGKVQQHGKEIPKGVDQLGRGAVRNPAKWLQSKLSSLSPTHFSVDSSCPALNASVTLPFHLSDFSPQEASHFGTVSVLGALHLRLGGNNEQLLTEDQVSTWLKGTLELITDSDYTLANFPTLIERRDNPKLTLDSLSSLQSGLVFSLANTELAMQTRGDRTMNTVRKLEGSGIEWLGTHAKWKHILILGKERVGVLAFCAIHKECGSSANPLPFSPVKYSTRAARTAVNELREHGVAVTVVLMYWGLENAYFPDETALTVARQLANLGVSAVIGDHPNSIQDHAYFGNTLVVFSQGRLLSSTKVANYCWNKVSGEWRYSSSKTCSTVHPSARQKLLEREMETRIYKLHLSRNRPVLAEYVTVKLEDSDTGKGYSIRRPVPVSGLSSRWTTACSDMDTHCLACQHF